MIMGYTVAPDIVLTDEACTPDLTVLRLTLHVGLIGRQEQIIKSMDPNKFILFFLSKISRKCLASIFDRTLFHIITTNTIILSQSK